jgi:hypothetical protein
MLTGSSAKSTMPTASPTARSINGSATPVLTGPPATDLQQPCQPAPANPQEDLSCR